MAETRYAGLAGKHAFISGGASGIGAALVRRFAEQGAVVSFCDLLAEDGEALAAGLRAEGRAAAFHEADVTDRAAYSALIGRIGADRPIELLINNAASDQRHALGAVTPDFYDFCMRVNFEHCFWAMQAVAPQMQAKGGGAIVTLSSINALLAPADLPLYDAAKAALIGLTRAVGRSLGAQNIRVNAILPGWIVTDRQLKLWLTPEAEAEWMKLVALQRRLTADDVAEAALFLASDAAAGITCQTLIVDGGRV